ncbi:MAG: N-acetyl sugar amidotransferase [Chitinophagaceae bacterium]
MSNSFSDNKYTSILHKYPYQICTNCVMDTTDPLITFDERGVCNHCNEYKEYEKTSKLFGEEAKAELQKMVNLLKKSGKGKEYDCIMGLSGGVDSSYLAYFATKELGLRPLVVHVDAGWNSELAVNNIQSIVQKLNLDLHTLVIDWEEIKDLQLAFLKSGIANLDVPQDHAFIASLYQEAKKYKIKYILNGGNMATESILPKAWGYDASDSVHLKAIHNKFGTIKLKSYPIFTTFKKLIYYPFIAKMKVLRPLELIPYSKSSAKKVLIEELGWRDYGGKHYESTYTKFFQAHYLPTKFGYDKRKAHLSSLIVSGQMTREASLAELEHPLYDSKELVEDTIFFSKKLGITVQEFTNIMNQEPTTYKNFANNESFYKIIRKLLSKASSLKKKLVKLNFIIC